ncbi:TPA: TIR domain-containing protein [Pseudomonas aeruginosa]|uniref:TIR domain-containing protein n=1 Tax=Pseudomonas guariconensis TaxID=1288410 RepID=UPI00209B06A3|nr:TIR domain-containing protein [Pseudomonas guariconensis]MCO7621257.1 TIR domain-containing protein [Pseudomonas guariconensis]HBO8838474.1 TIR domain-containing protein [Pseudomonas aeruginosa]
MARNVFFSFHFKNDFWRTQQVRNIGTLDGQKLYKPNEWEEVKKKGNAAIEKWIDDSLVGKSCVVVLVGSETASRPWVVTEIIKGWNAGKGVVAIRINKLLDTDGNAAAAGANPFDQVTLKNGTVKLSNYAKLITPVGADSKAVYASIQANIEQWIEDAIAIRDNYKP